MKTHAAAEVGNILHLGLSPEKPYLGSPGVLDKLLRDIIATVAELTQKKARGEAVDSESELNRLTDEFQKTVYGHNEAYVASPWNSPAHLGRYLVERVYLGGKEDDAAKRLADAYIRSFLVPYIAYAEGKIEDSTLESIIDKHTRTYVSHLQGLPPPLD